MEHMSTPQERERLQKIMMSALQNDIQTLTPELQYLLTDDLVTAFQNRLTVFQRISQKQSHSQNNPQNHSHNP